MTSEPIFKQQNTSLLLLLTKTVEKFLFIWLVRRAGVAGAGRAKEGGRSPADGPRSSLDRLERRKAFVRAEVGDVLPTS